MIPELTDDQVDAAREEMEFGPTREPASDAEFYLELRGQVDSPFGVLQQVQIGAYDGRSMLWREVWEQFALAFPRCWALQVFPPSDSLVDDVNAYHLWVLPEGVSPGELRIDRRQEVAP